MTHGRKDLRGTILITLILSVVIFPAYAAETAIDQKNHKFVPNSVTINVGDSIRFTNSDRFYHDVTIVNPDGTSSDKGLVNYKEEFAISFEKPGTYKVRCRLHPTMSAVIIVK